MLLKEQVLKFCQATSPVSMASSTSWFCHICEMLERKVANHFERKQWLNTEYCHFYILFHFISRNVIIDLALSLRQLPLTFPQLIQCSRWEEQEFISDSSTSLQYHRCHRAAWLASLGRCLSKGVEMLTLCTMLSFLIKPDISEL